MQPREVLFSEGEDSQAGIFIVVEGGLGVYLDEGEELRLTNILRTGESVGDLDVLDGEPCHPPCLPCLLKSCHVVLCYANSCRGCKEDRSVMSCIFIVMCHSWLNWPLG